MCLTGRYVMSDPFAPKNGLYSTNQIDQSRVGRIVFVQLEPSVTLNTQPSPEGVESTNTF